LAIQFEEVERVKEDMFARRPAPQPFEHREPVLIAGDRFAINQARADLEMVGRAIGTPFLCSVPRRAGTL